jgi:hypothetical protein
MTSQLMTCPLKTKETTHVLLDYTARRLDAPRAVLLEQHMDGCPECALYRLEQAAVWDALDTWEAPPVAMDFNRRLWQRIDAAAVEPWYKTLAASLRFADWKPVLPLTAAILVVAAGFLLDHSGDRAVMPGNAVSGVSVREADQVEQMLDDIQLLHQFDSAVLPATSNPKSM